MRSLCRSGVVVCLLLLSELGTPAAAQTVSGRDDVARKARFESLWQSAEEPHQRGDYAASEQLYRQALAEDPASQRAALRLAIAQERQGKVDAALRSYDSAVNVDPQGQWAPVALFYKARACKENQRGADARVALARLRAEHPDSSYVARAAVLEAELDGRPTATAEAELERELAAAAVYDAAMAKSSERRDEEALEQLRRVPAEFPGTGAALRALEAEGHVLLRLNRREESLLCFESLLGSLGEDSANSRIALTAHRRIAGIQHALLQREDALSSFNELLQLRPADTRAESDALLQSAGLMFELILEDHGAGKPISSEQVLQLEAALEAVRKHPNAPRSDVVRADLMYLESLAWRNKYEALVAEGDLFLAKYTLEEFPKEVATANYFLGAAKAAHRDYRNALPHLKAVIAASPDGELWDGMNHVEYAHFRAVECALLLGDQREANALTADFRNTFENSAWLRLLEKGMASNYYSDLRMKRQREELEAVK